MHKQITIDEDILDNFVEFLEAHEDDIIYNYKGKNNQILINSSLVKHIVHFIKKQKTLKEESLSDFVKAYIRAAFELTNNSVVISKNGHIFIKIIDETVKKQIPEEEKNTVKNRYNGIKEEELESFYKEFFEEEENQHFFFEIAQEFFEKNFIEKKISNDEYEKKAFSYIHNLTLKKLMEIYDDEDGFFLGFAGYIFRIHFKEVFTYLAEFILDEFALSNQHILDFLNYYAQDILVIGGEKYKVPHIEAENGLRWTVPSMLSIVKIYTKAKKNIIMLKKERNALQQEVQKFYINGLSPIKNNELLKAKKINLEIQIEELSRKINKQKNRLETTKNEEKKKIIREDILRKQEQRNALRKQREKVLKNIVKKSSLTQYMILQKELDTLSRKLQREKKVIKQNEEAYNSIKTSLVKALISKKSKI